MRPRIAREDVRRFLALFYEDDGVLASQEANLLQSLQDLLVGLFERMGLHTNVIKTKCETMVPGRIRTRLLNTSYARQWEGIVSSAEWRCCQVDCNYCRKQLQAQLLYTYLATQHDVFKLNVVDQELMEEIDGCAFRAYSKSE